MSAPEVAPEAADVIQRWLKPLSLCTVRCEALTLLTSSKAEVIVFVRRPMSALTLLSSITKEDTLQTSSDADVIVFARCPMWSSDDVDVI